MSETFSGSYSLGANSPADAYVDYEDKSGYAPLFAIVEDTGFTYANVYYCAIETGKVHLRVQNLSGTGGNRTMKARVYYIRQ